MTCQQNVSLTGGQLYCSTAESGLQSMQCWVTELIFYFSHAAPSLHSGDLHRI